MQKFLTLLITACASLTMAAIAQVPASPTTTIPVVISNGVSETDLSVIKSIPMFSKKGRGIDVNLSAFIYNPQWTVTWVSGVGPKWSSSGTQYVAPIMGGYMYATETVKPINNPGYHCPAGYVLTYVDSSGMLHNAGGPISVANSCGYATSGSGYMTDLSGYFISDSMITSTYSVYSPDGTNVSGPIIFNQTGPQTAYNYPTITDANGNQPTLNGTILGNSNWSSTINYETDQTTYGTDGNFYMAIAPSLNIPPPNASYWTLVNGLTPSPRPTSITDTLGMTAVTFGGAGIPSYPSTLTYTGPNGSETVTINFTSITLASSFGCSGIYENTEAPAGSGPSVSVPSSIVYPDGSEYTFTYTGDGRISVITLPTGGTISYSYPGTNKGYMCPAYESGIVTSYTGGLATAVNVAMSGGTWSYSRTTGTDVVTTVTGPNGQERMDTFVDTVSSSLIGPVLLEVQSLVYNGGSSPIRSINICYDGDAYPCTTESINNPYSQVVTDVLSGGKISQTINTLTPYTMLPLSSAAYDFGPTLNHTKVISYGSWNGSSCTTLGNNIVNKPCQIQTLNSSGTQVALRSFMYDGGTPTPTTGTPNHVSITGSRGNVTTVSDWTGGSNYLTNTKTYYDTGNVASSTDVNSAVTNYTYGACGNSFVTLVALPLSLTQGYAWESTCNGAVVISKTDANGQIVQTGYTDADFWRPTSTTDELHNATTIAYLYSSGTLPAGTETTLNYGTSTNDHRNNTDSYGRGHVSQIETGPSSGLYNSVQTNYDNSGRVSRVSMPFQSATGDGNDFAPVTTQTYDSAERKLVTTDYGGGTITFCYTPSANGGCAGTTETNDILATLGPAPAGETVKQKQYEYNALGQLTSVCELTSLPGSGTCGQTVAQTGYWTTYTYDALGNMLAVKENAQGTPRTRTFTYDGQSRKLTVNNPETGLVQYFYDTAPASPGATCASSSFPGDLVKTYNAKGQTICDTYDLLHRNTAILAPGQTATLQRYFVYDSSTVDGAAMTNPAGRLVEAYLDSSTDKVNDMGFSYGPRGELYEQYVILPDASPYQTFSYGYDAAGHASSFSTSLTGMPSLTFSPNGEGQLNQLTSSDTNNPSWLYGATYNSAGEATVVDLVSSSYLDTFTFDRSTGRWTSGTYTVSGASNNISITPTWNANWTVASSVTVDPNNAVNNQTCSYAHDAIGQLASVNCGATEWQQNFTFDVFGNLTKTVPTGGTGVTWNPGYNPTNNQVDGNTYDANGNTLTDQVHTYTWNLYNHLATVDGKAVKQDPFGQQSEADTTGAYVEFYQTPIGLLLATSGHLNEARIKLPGGVIADYVDGNLYFLHSDWRGNLVAKTTSSAGYVGSEAYAPYGEQYDGTNLVNFFMGLGSDTVTGETDTATRKHQWASGRFIQPDPSGHFDPMNPRGANQYAYANSPVENYDPTGLRSIEGLACDEGDIMICSFAPDYVVNGAEVPGSVGLGVLRSGTGVQCPNNICSSTNYFGLPVQYHVTAVAGYYSALVPGVWPTAQAAGQAAAGSTDPQSIATNRELSGNIYQMQNGKYSWTFPAMGGAIDSPFDPNAIPDGTTFAGSYHDHGAFALASDENFSPQGCNGGKLCDIGIATSAIWNPTNQAFFLGTPEGRIEMLDPNSIGAFPNGCVLFGSPVPAGGGAVAVPSCP
jgi:RHS repeat-associated protein